MGYDGQERPLSSGVLPSKSCKDSCRHELSPGRSIGAIATLAARSLSSGVRAFRAHLRKALARVRASMVAVSRFSRSTIRVMQAAAIDIQNRPASRRAAVTLCAPMAMTEEQALTPALTSAVGLHH